jgi:succinate dehydrogenase/fumarate reductase cytochrome b subunit
MFSREMEAAGEKRSFDWKRKEAQWFWVFHRITGVKTIAARRTAE